MKFVGRWLVRIFSGMLILAILAIGAVFYAFWYYGQDVPDYQSLADYEPPIVTRVYANTGRLIGEYAPEKRVFVPVDRIPERVIRAFVAAEDQRFYSHGGVDYMGLVRAAWTNVRNMGGERRLVGGSTITQQVAKNFLLTSDQTIERKIKEMILAFRFERTFSKNQILELYLNEIFLGNRAYGVAAAAQVYFDKTLEELSVAEVAFLAGLPQAPSRYNPETNYDVALNRRNYVIRRMEEDGYITAEEAEAARKTPIETIGRQPYISGGQEYFFEEVRRRLLARYGEERLNLGGFQVRSTLDPRLQEIADRSLRNGIVAYDRRHGYRGPVDTINDGTENWADGWRKKLEKIERPSGHGGWPLAVVLDVERDHADIGFADGTRGRIPLREVTWAATPQKIPRPDSPHFVLTTRSGQAVRDMTELFRPGDAILVERVESYSQGGKTVEYPPDTYTLRQIPIATGAIVAMDPHTGRVLAMTGGFSFWISQYNAAVQAMRQPGSTLKPFVFLAALDAGYTPSTMVLDAPVVVKLDSGRNYKPRNYGGKFFGPMTMRRALEQSRNLVTVRVANRTGLDRVADVGVKMGLYDTLPPEMAMALGAYETTPLRMAAGYAMLVNGGKKITPHFIDRVQDRYGKTILRTDDRPCELCGNVEWNGQAMPTPPDTREQIADPRSAFQVVSMLRGVVTRGTAAAVGAGVGKPVAGKTGTTNEVLDTWFVGFSPDLVVAVWVGFEKPQSLGFAEQGGRTAAPIFTAFMREALKDAPATEFRVPPGLVTMRVNVDNGLPSDGDRAIYEYFKPGDVPTRQGAMSPDGRQNFGSDDSRRLPGEW